MYLCRSFIYSHGFCCSKWWHAVFLYLSHFSFHLCTGSLVHKLLQVKTVVKISLVIVFQTVLLFNPISFFLELCLSSSLLGIKPTCTYLAKNTVVQHNNPEQVLWECSSSNPGHVRFDGDPLFFVHRTKMSLAPLLQLQLSPLLWRGTVAAACQTFSVTCSKTPLLNTGPIYLTSTVKYAPVNGNCQANIHPVN